MRFYELSLSRVFPVLVLTASLTLPALAASHSWAPVEVYSDAGGTIQFVELHCPAGAANETGIATRYLKAEQSGHQTGPFGHNLPAGSTSDKRLLFATAGFAALPGAPAPDFIMADGFFSTNSETIRWWEYTFVWSTMIFGPGDVPIGGDESLNWNGSTLSVSTATPTNFAGAGFRPPGVADSLLVGKALADGSRLDLTWDDAGCLGAQAFQIAYGWGSQLPSSPGGSYGLQPANAPEQCSILASPKTWTGVPDPAVDSTHLMWFTVLAEDGAVTEGSLGADSAGGERTGPGTSGSTGQCGNLIKSLANTCGQ